jgi:DNA-binding response OmpR family regulator
VELLVSLSNLLTSEFQISQAKNGTKGLAMAKEKNPELIISDVMLPGMNGFELCRRIKEDITTCHIPVILLTAKVANEDKLEGFKVGADAYITKPFHVDLLIAQINSLLSNRKKITNKFRQTPLFPDTLQMHTQPDQQFLEEAGEIVERNIDNPDFDVQIFLSEMRISNSMLYRKLKVLTGLSPNEFIRNIRLKTACKLLKTGEYNISEIAYKVGFNDAKYFSSCFKKEFNLTPSEYILNNVTSS